MRWRLLGALLLAASLVDGAVAGEPRIAGPISYIRPQQQTRQLQAKKEGSAAAKAIAAASQPATDPAVGSWWVQDASEKHAAEGKPVTEKATGKHKAARAEGEKGRAASSKGMGSGKVTSVDGQKAEDALQGVWTLPTGTGSRQAALGNLYVAAKMSPLAVSPKKSFQGEKPDMPDSTQIDNSKYPDADLADTAGAAGPTPAAASPAPASPADLQGSAAAALQAASPPSGQLAAPAKITPRLPPPPPPGPPVPPGPSTVSACSGYLTKEEIVAGLEYAAGQEYLPFDPCWDARLAALKSFYGQPAGVAPFAYLNPGGYVSNVSFWVNALKDYADGEAPYILIPGTAPTNSSSNGTTSSSLSVPVNADGVSTVTPPATPPADAPVTTGYGINWYGGPVLNNKAGIVLYYVWYGGWGNINNQGTASRPTTVKVLTDLAQSIGSTPWFNIGTTYNDQNGAVVNKIKYGGRTAITSSNKCWQGRTLTNDQIFTAVDCAIQKNLLPYATNAVYLVLGASNIKVNSGMCVSYCGWHTYGFDSQNRQTLFGFIGSPLPCLNACTAQGASNVLATPNYNAEADGMASITAHEIAEAASDPLINAWYTAAGYENADLCAWTFSQATFPAGGGLANVRWNCPAAAKKQGCISRYYLIQQNWVNQAPGYCALSIGGSGK